MSSTIADVPEPSSSAPGAVDVESNDPPARADAGVVVARHHDDVRRVAAGQPRDHVDDVRASRDAVAADGAPDLLHFAVILHAETAAAVAAVALELRVDPPPGRADAARR